MQFSRFLFALICSLLLASCGGGSSSTISSPDTRTLSGQVLVPNGMLSSLDKPSVSDRLLNVLLPTAVADLTGISSAPNGTTVELVRLNVTASVDPGSVLATTTTNSSGRYSFNLSNLSGATPDITLAVRLGNAPLRSIVTGSVIDITPESELIFQRIVTAVTGSSALTDFTIEEVEALVSGLRRATTANSGTVSGLDIASTIAAIDTILMGNADLINFVTDAAATGQVLQGPGNSNYVPLTQGAVYTYQGNSSISGAYANTTTISGTQSVDAVSTTRFVSTNLLNEGADTSFVASNLTGVFDYSVVESGVGSEPLSLILFPNIANESVVSDDTLTVDVRTFRFTFSSFSLLPTLTVQGVTYNNVIQTRGLSVGINSSDREVEDLFFAPTVGLIRRFNVSTLNNVTETITEDLTTVTGL